MARRYARALLALASTGDGATGARDADASAERIDAQLKALAAALDHSPEARNALLHPGYSSEQRHKIVDQLATQLQLAPAVANFLRLLLDRKRIPALPAIARAYGEMLDARVGRVQAIVTTAQPLSEAELGHVRDALARATSRTIVLSSKTEPALIGGVVAQVGGTVYDGSLRTQLLRLRDELKQTPI